jgi:hypothetical protein
MCIVNVSAQYSGFEELLNIPVSHTLFKRRAESDVDEVIEVAYAVNKCIASYNKARVDETVPRRLFT